MKGLNPPQADLLSRFARLAYESFYEAVDNCFSRVVTFPLRKNKRKLKLFTSSFKNKPVNFNSRTHLYGVLGYPVSHSLSPVMHNHAFSQTGYNGVYLAFEVKDVPGAITGIKALGIKGASVTVPHKIAVMDFLDELDQTALKIGAVNTIVNKQGRLVGYNTDALGAVTALLEKTEIKGKNVVIIGAGGAGRAIGFGIISSGGNVIILNRSPNKGENLAKALGGDFVPLYDFKGLNCDILINTTPVGMVPDIEKTPINKKYLNNSMVVMDIVYNPLKTRLLKEAKDSGCLTVDGASMFVYQGAVQFELWTGKKAPVIEMKKVVLDSLTNDRN